MTKLPFYEEHDDCTVYFIEIDEDGGEDIDDYTPAELGRACDSWGCFVIDHTEVEWIRMNVYSVTVYYEN